MIRQIAKQQKQKRLLNKKIDDLTLELKKANKTMVIMAGNFAKMTEQFEELTNKSRKERSNLPGQTEVDGVAEEPMGKEESSIDEFSNKLNTCVTVFDTRYAEEVQTGTITDVAEEGTNNDEKGFTVVQDRKRRRAKPLAESNSDSDNGYKIKTMTPHPHITSG